MFTSHRPTCLLIFAPLLVHFLHIDPTFAAASDSHAQLAQYICFRRAGVAKNLNWAADTQKREYSTSTSVYAWAGVDFESNVFRSLSYSGAAKSLVVLLPEPVLSV